MYSGFRLARKYLRYYITAGNGKGHGIHSPFVFDFIKYVLNDRTKYKEYLPVEKIRRDLLNDKSLIEVEDFGAGSAHVPFKMRKVNDIAHSSLKPKKFAQLLFRITKYYKRERILELGTSLGVTTSYLASANPDAVVHTMEGSKNIAAIARQNFLQNQLTNIKITEGNFDTTLSHIIQSSPDFDLVFIDGNHRKKPTLDYFEALLNSIDTNTIFIFDDIHWSKEMEEAWEEIKQHPSVTLTIDLFFIGLVFFKKEFKVPQHFTIRF